MDPLTLSIDVKEVECRPPSAEWGTRTDWLWWETEGQHSNYLRVTMVDSTGGTPMQSIVKSPYFRRDGTGAITRERAIAETLSFTARTLESRFTSLTT